MIIINGKFLSQKLTGVQRVAFEIVKRIDSCSSFVQTNNIVLISPKEVEESYNIKFRNIIWIKKGKLSPFWEYTTLSWEVLKNKASCFSFSSGFPILCSSGIYFFHDTAFKDVPDSFSAFYRIKYDMISRYIQNNKDVILITNSEFSKKSILKWYPKLVGRVFVVPLGWEHIKDITEDNNILEKLHLNPQDYFLTIATLNKRKNLGIILKLASMQPNLKFVVVGKKPEKRVFGKNTFDLLSLSNVIFTGHVADSELVSLLKNAKAFIFPSIYEGFGLPALEALYFNVPLILADIPVFREIYDGVAVYFNPFDPEDLLKKCYQIRKPGSRKREEILKNFSWDRCVKRIIEIWRARNHERNAG